MIVCNRCQQENDDDAQFCSSCRAYLGWAATRGRRAAPAPPPPPPQAPAPPPADDLLDDPEPPPVATPQPMERTRFRTVELGRSVREPDPPPLVVPPPAPQAPPPGIVAREPGRPEPPRPEPPDAPRAQAPAPPRHDTARLEPADPYAATTRLPPAQYGAGGQLICRTCGRDNEDSRRFCRRCGTALRPEALPQPPTPEPEPRPLPWYRRLFGSRSKQDFDQRMRGAARGGRVAWDRAVGLRARVVRLVIMAGALGMGASFLGPWSAGVRDLVDDTAARFLPVDYATVQVAGLTVVPDQPAAPDALPLFAIDGLAERSWVVGWTGGALAPEGDCGQVPAATAAVLELTFAQPQRIDRVQIVPGLNPQLRDDWARLVRPRTVDLLFSDGTCRRTVLDDAFEPQTIDADADDVTGARLVVIDGYPPADGAPEQAAITELTFQRRE